MAIAIIDYGSGNLGSLQNALSRLGFVSQITSDAEQILTADKIILPGVGAFADAMRAIRANGLPEVIEEAVNYKVPLLGICLGMQMLFTESYENGRHRGLNIIPGYIARFNLPDNYKVPHMGWNSIIPKEGSHLLRDIPEGSHFYFVHSYYAVPESSEFMAATCDYGADFCCAAEKGNVFATQFHPEKSSSMGLKILKNFGEI